MPFSTPLIGERNVVCLVSEFYSACYLTVYILHQVYLLVETETHSALFDLLGITQASMAFCPTLSHVASVSSIMLQPEPCTLFQMKSIALDVSVVL